MNMLLGSTFVLAESRENLTIEIELIIPGVVDRRVLVSNVLIGAPQ